MTSSSPVAKTAEPLQSLVCKLDSMLSQIKLDNFLVLFLAFISLHSQ